MQILRVLTLLFMSGFALAQQTGPGNPPPSMESRLSAQTPCRIVVDGSEQNVPCQPGDYKRPVILFQAEPIMSKEARKHKISGNVLVEFVVNLQGKPENVHVVRGVGYGLDEQAVLVAQKYLFKPATLKGQPVASKMSVDVNFQSF